MIDHIQWRNDNKSEGPLHSISDDEILKNDRKYCRDNREMMMINIGMINHHQNHHQDLQQIQQQIQQQQHHQQSSKTSPNNNNNNNKEPYE